MGRCLAYFLRTLTDGSQRALIPMSLRKRGELEGVNRGENPKIWKPRWLINCKKCWMNEPALCKHSSVLFFSCTITSLNRNWYVPSLALSKAITSQSYSPWTFTSHQLALVPLGRLRSSSNSANWPSSTMVNRHRPVLSNTVTGRNPHEPCRKQSAYLKMDCHPLHQAFTITQTSRTVDHRQYITMPWTSMKQILIKSWTITQHAFSTPYESYH